MTVNVGSPNGDTNFFDIVAGVLEGDTFVVGPILMSTLLGLQT